MASERRRYTREFKIEAVELSQQSGKSIAQVARDLGITPRLLYRWRGEVLADGEQAFPGSGRLKEPEEELRQLRRQLAMAEQEREILKKALAIFSKEKR
jgi:transposase